MLQKPEYPPEPKWSEIGREDFCDLSINDLIWVLFGDPQKVVAEHRNAMLPDLEKEYGGHLPQELINYLDNQIFNRMKQTAKDAQESMRSVARKEKLLDAAGELIKGAERASMAVAAIGVAVASEGIAIPIIAGAFGAGEAVMAASDLGEGVQDAVAASTGKHVCTQSFHLVRDGLCGGNERLSNIIGTVMDLGCVGVTGAYAVKSLRAAWKAGKIAGEVPEILRSTGAPRMINVEGRVVSSEVRQVPMMLEAESKVAKSACEMPKFRLLKASETQKLLKASEVPKLLEAECSSMRNVVREAPSQLKAVQRMSYVVQPIQDLTIQKMSYTVPQITYHTVQRITDHTVPKMVAKLETTGEGAVEQRAANAAERGTDVGTDAVNKAPYDPRKMESMLKERYGDDITSRALPRYNQPNVKLAGKSIERTIVTNAETEESVIQRIVFDKRGFPIFDPYVKVETRIAGELHTMDRAAHMRAATRQLRADIELGVVDRSLFTDSEFFDIIKGKSKIGDYTWHHHQDTGRMQLVPTSVHKWVKHVGGFDLWGKK